LVYDLSSYTTLTHVANLGHAWYFFACCVVMVTTALQVLKYFTAESAVAAAEATRNALVLTGIVLKYHVAIFLCMCVLKGIVMYVGIGCGGIEVVSDYDLFGFAVLITTQLMWAL